MAEIRWTQEAISWLQDIHSHISNDSQNIANKVVHGIFEFYTVSMKQAILLITYGLKKSIEENKKLKMQMLH